MRNPVIIGREQERQRLRRCLAQDTAQLAVVYGRRRVGKTFLIQQTFEGKFAFHLTGAFGQPRSTQLRNFVAELDRQSGEIHHPPKDWIQAFEMLRDHLESLSPNEKHVVFFDELPWLDTVRSGFLSAFEWFWNDYGSAKHNLVFIVCGSATAWMTSNIAKNKGGLFNRQTCRIWLLPFTLRETEMYLESMHFHWSRYDIAECYMVMGGIPYYLSLLDPDLSYGENIDTLFFRNKGELWDEFSHLYHTLFSNSEQYIRVVEILARRTYGLTRREIADATGLAFNGVLSRILGDLADSGFIRRYRHFSGKRKTTVYQLADYYSLFYIRFIKEHYGRDEHFWGNTSDHPSRRAWAGLTFEQLCRDHIRQIKKKLGIEGVLSEESSWMAQSDKTGNDGARGAQIDLVIDRRDRVINLCEIKFSINEYEIDKEYDGVLRSKIDAFRRMTDTKKSLQLTMITTYGVKPNMYSNIARSQVVLDDFFTG